MWLKYFISSSATWRSPKTTTNWPTNPWGAHKRPLPFARKHYVCGGVTASGQGFKRSAFRWTRAAAAALAKWRLRWLQTREPTEGRKPTTPTTPTPERTTDRASLFFW